VGIFAKLIASLGSAGIGAVVNGIMGPFLGLAEQYFKKQISLAELKTKMGTVLTEGFTSVEKSHAESLTATMNSFYTTMAQSKLMQYVWGFVVVSQTLVLVWHQVGIPAVVKICRSGLAHNSPGWLACSYPSSGSSVEWAYLLITALCGAGVVLLRNGPGKGDVSSRLKELVK
jgi:hypothetical protein